MNNQDRAIIATLTAQPKYIFAWDEYAALDNNGVLHSYYTRRECEASLKEANELIARHARVNVVLTEAQAE